MTAGGLSFSMLIPDSGTNAIGLPYSTFQQYVTLNNFYCLPSSMQNFPTSISAPSGGTWSFTFSMSCYAGLQPQNCVPNPGPGETACFCAFDEVGGPATIYDGMFIFGLPLFYGRDVYIVYSYGSAPPPLGNGPLYGFAGH